jgi:dTDP-4-amino-4,6-dideoxygalactose transaminase
VAVEGAPCFRPYPTPLHQQPVFTNAGFGRVPCPNAEALANQLFSLQVHPSVQQGDLDDLIAAIEKVAAAYRKG